MSTTSFGKTYTQRTHRAPRFSTGSLRVIALATETPSLVILGPPKLWPVVESATATLSRQTTRTDDDGPALGTEGGRDGLCEDVYTLEHALPGVVAEDDVLGGESPLLDSSILDEPCGAGKSSARSERIHFSCFGCYEQVRNELARRNSPKKYSLALNYSVNIVGINN